MSKYSPLTVLVDENMPFARQLLDPLGRVITKPGRNLTSDDLIGVDALLVRSVTQVNATLLKQAHDLKFVGTATIGVDHINQSLLDDRGIGFSSAPGCNRIAVGEYVITSLLAVAEKEAIQLKGKTMAVVGAGHTGSEVALRAKAIGMNVVCYDPPLAALEHKSRFCDFDTVLKADVISLHVPLTVEGHDATYHLFNEEVLSQLTPDQILINACRGEVVDNLALLRQAELKRTPTLIWDVWEKEPHILNALVPYTAIATPHIAGYSLEGKMRGTSMVHSALCQFLGRDIIDISQDLLPMAKFSRLELTQTLGQSELSQLTQLIYNVQSDDYRFRRVGLTADGFDKLRRNYPQRREFSSLQLSGHTCVRLAELGFSIKEIINDSIN